MVFPYPPTSMTALQPQAPPPTHRAAGQAAGSGRRSLHREQLSPWLGITSSLVHWLWTKQLPERHHFAFKLPQQVVRQMADGVDKSGPDPYAEQ